MRTALSFDERDNRYSVSPSIVGNVYVILRGIGCDAVEVFLITATRLFPSRVASNESNPGNLNQHVSRTR